MSTKNSLKRNLEESKDSDVKDEDSNKENENPSKRRKLNPVNNNNSNNNNNNNSTSESSDDEEEIDYSSMKVKELKALCKSKGLLVGGNKTQLINRLKNPDDDNNKRVKSKDKKGNNVKKRMTLKGVNKQLKQLLGVNAESVSLCFRAGIGRGYFKLCGPNGETDKESILNKVIYSGSCICCSKTLDCTIRDVLDQPDYAGLDYEDGGQNGAAQCEECCGNYLEGMCEGKLSYGSGKFHNHCTECKGFGKCIGDYREAHCFKCGKHFFQGLSGFSCPCEERRSGGLGNGMDLFSMLFF